MKEQMGFPVTYERGGRGIVLRCHFCVDSFLVDKRGVPLLKHPEHGQVIVCYRCAVELAEEV